MRLRQGTGCLVLLLAAGLAAPVAGPAAARTLQEAEQPAEYPPASYTGSQYVDSRGCVYIRAGFDDAVTWVPRVDRRRQVLCGFTPSAAGGTAVTTAPVIGAPAGTGGDLRIATDPAPAPRIVVPGGVAAPQTGAEAPGAPRAAQGAAPRVSANIPRRVAPAGSPPGVDLAPTPPAPGMARGRVVAQSSDAPVRLERAAPSTRITPAEPPRRIARAAVPAAIAPVREAAVSPASAAAPRTPPASKTRALAPRRVVGPRPGETVRVTPAEALRVPEGYKPAWSDGRLNPDRGKQTFRGALQTALVWTQTVPRKLVDPRGLDVTETYNYLVYPYTDYAKQKRDLAGGRKVVVRTSSGRMIVDRDRIRVSRQSGKTVLVPDTGARSPDRPAGRNRASGGSAPQIDQSADNPQLRAAPLSPRIAAAPAPSGGGRFVQVGAFAVPQNAHSTAARLMSKGIPARIVSQRSGGRTLDVVLAGPFREAAPLRSTLALVKRSGFPDAFAR
ncbi:SPOR domain-containing protein [Profundibacterium mesophilum]|uniref:DNA polymerase III subunit gamma and tau n=1 Tax=Profundibacterium mesophilum KAUST100406-0324 TaxID=1037889 RepID=A0A921TEE4_9RHOB|nr:SPOR domain-containing protein [Profundibacterium mesophilum]KAF0677232.1 DNA polymerase III subunit gamma and tau [Profundibacterium mesophilum KAUST100406-0324]